MLNIGNKEVKEIYLGNKKVSEVYLGEKKIRPVVPERKPWEHTWHYYPLKENQNDLWKRAAHGNSSGVYIRNGSMYFPGNASINTNTQLPSSGSWTISLWFSTDKEFLAKDSSGNWAYGAMIGKYWGFVGSRESFVLWLSCRELNGNKIWYWSRNTAGTESDPRSWEIEGIRAEVGKWYLATVSYNNDTQTLLFANNGEVKRTVNVNQNGMWGYPLSIGAMNNVNNKGSFFMWYIREVIIEDIARNEAKIADYYNSTKWQFWL